MKTGTFSRIGFQMAEMLSETAATDLPSLAPLAEEESICEIHSPDPAPTSASPSNPPHPTSPGGRVVQETTPLIP